MPSRRSTSPRGSRKPETPKLQRWIDLLAALLARRYPATFEELCRDVPAYRNSGGSALARMFERDKDELRNFGVPIETVEIEGEDQPSMAYQLRSRDFYLPFLAVAASGSSARRTAAAAQYRSLEQLTFEPDELSAVVDAAARVRALGDPLLAAEAESAVRKLAFDLAVDATQPSDFERIVIGRVDQRAFALLGRAVLDHKRVTFDYQAMNDGQTTHREVEPYGLAFLSAHWYLVARDCAKNELRHFRLSRMINLAINKKRSQSPDFEVPADFRLDDHARSREAWALGDDEVVDAVVEFSGYGGVVKGRKLGEAVRGQPGRRHFRVRRLDSFARWLLTFGGNARPVEPPALVERFRAIARETLALYGDDA